MQLDTIDESKHYSSEDFENSPIDIVSVTQIDLDKYSGSSFQITSKDDQNEYQIKRGLNEFSELRNNLVITFKNFKNP